MHIGMTTGSSIAGSWYHSSSLMSGVAAVAATCYFLSTANSKATIASFTPRPTYRYISSAISLATLEFASPLEEMHDLDDDDDDGDQFGFQDSARNIHGDKQILNELANEKDMALDQLHRDVLDEDAQGDNNNNMLDQDDDEYNKLNVIERFSRVIAKEIMLRLPWRGQNKKQPKRKYKKAQQGWMNKEQSKIIVIQSERRVGAWCPPNSAVDSDDASEVEVGFADKAVVTCSPDSSKKMEGSDNCSHGMNGGDKEKRDIVDDVEPGMVVYVFPQGKLDMEQEPLVDSSASLVSDGTTSLERIESNNAEQDGGGAEKSDSTIHGTRCLVDMGHQYDNNEQVVQYTLLQQEPVELGNIDVHRNDFAYRPVVLTIDTSTSDAISYTGIGLGHELETRIKPEDEVLATFSPSVSPGKSRWDDVGDQQVSFRWWSWVAQFLHQGDNYSGNGDNEGTMKPEVVIAGPSERHAYQYHGQQSIYEEAGERAFAGGSHGEIWRARRKCPMNNKAREDSSNHTNTFFCDDGKDLIVKRLKIEYGYGVLEAGLREVYFGELLAREVESSNLFTTYIDHFFREGIQSQVELWIVFENAGPSLRSFLYTPIDSAGFMIYTHSQFWVSMMCMSHEGQMFFL